MPEITSSTRSAASQDGCVRRVPGPRPILYGLPCANCRLYYAAELTACPICNCDDRISPVTALVHPAAMQNSWEDLASGRQCEVVVSPNRQGIRRLRRHRVRQRQNTGI